MDFQWCVELEMESLLSIPYFQCGIPGECCISFHLYRMYIHYMQELVKEVTLKHHSNNGLVKSLPRGYNS